MDTEREAQNIDLKKAEQKIKKSKRGRQTELPAQPFKFYIPEAAQSELEAEELRGKGKSG